MPTVSEEQRRYDMGYATGYQKGLDVGRAEVGIKVFKDGSAWCALVGASLQDGLAGFGNTPVGALMDLIVKNGGTLNAALGGENVDVPDEADEADD